MRRATARSGFVAGTIAVLFLTACSSTTQGQPAPATTAAPATSASSSADPTTASPEAGGASGELDADTTAWFQAFCTGFTEQAQYARPDTSGQSTAELQATISTAYTSITDSANDSAFAMEEAPVPTIAGGAELDAAGVEWFRIVGAVYGQGAERIDALPVPTQTELREEVQQVEQEATGLLPDIDELFDADVLAAARALPECASVWA